MKYNKFFRVKTLKPNIAIVEKAIIFLSMLSICAISYSASIEENLKSIESKYDSILKKEEEKKLELRSERDKLNEEVANLTKILDRKEAIKTALPPV